MNSEVIVNDSITNGSTGASSSNSENINGISVDANLDPLPVYSVDPKTKKEYILAYAHNVLGYAGEIYIGANIDPKMTLGTVLMANIGLLKKNNVTKIRIWPTSHYWNIPFYDVPDGIGFSTPLWLLKNCRIELKSGAQLRTPKQNDDVIPAPQRLLIWAKIHAGLSEQPADNVFKFTSSMITCCVCIQDYEEGEEVTKLGNCGHYFHKKCISKWFDMKNSVILKNKCQEVTCPLCCKKSAYS